MTTTLPNDPTTLIARTNLCALVLVHALVVVRAAVVLRQQDAHLRYEMMVLVLITSAVGVVKVMKVVWVMCAPWARFP